MRTIEVGGTVAQAAKAGDVAPIRIEVVNKTRTVAITHEKVAVRHDGRVSRLVLSHVGIFRTQLIGIEAAQLAAIRRAHGDDLPIVIGDPVTVLALLFGNFKSMSAWKAILPRRAENAGFGIGNEIVTYIVGKRNDSPSTILGDAVAIPHRILIAIEQAPMPMRAIAKSALS